MILKQDWMLISKLIDFLAFFSHPSVNQLYKIQMGSVKENYGLS
jgi:hypothetical protein